MTKQWSERMSLEKNFELVESFWRANENALFTQTTIAAVLCISVKTLESNRWLKEGINYIKMGGRVLYRKSDVIKYINSRRMEINFGDDNGFKKED